MNSIELARNAEVRIAPLGQIAAILSRRKWMILIVFILIVAAVAVATLRMPKQYEAHMKILVKNERANMVVSTGVNAQSSAPGEVSETEINTEIELLNSSDLLRQVASASGLERAKPARRTSAAESGQKQLESAVAALHQGLKISPVRKAAIIEVHYTAGDPRQAVDVLRQLAASYLEAHLRIHGSPGTREFFSSQTARYQSELNDAETRLRDFRREKDIVLFPEQKEEILRRASESSSMLLAAEAGISEYKSKIADARSQASAAAPRVITQSRTLSNQTSVERLGTMLVDLQNRRTQLLSKYRSDDRLVLEVSEEIANTQSALEKAKVLTGSDQATDVNPVYQTLALDIAKEQAELAGMEARRQQLIRQTDQYRAQLNKLGSSTTDYDDLIRNQKEAEDNYLLYARKTEEARIADELDQKKIANVAIMESPVEPLEPSAPNVARNLSLGIIVAAFFSLGTAFFTEYLGQPFPPDAESRLGFGPGSGAQPILEVFELPVDLEALTGLPVLAITRRS